MSIVAVVGAGSWGTALAVHLGRIGHNVRLWVRESDLVADMQASRVNRIFLPGVGLPPSVAPCSAFEQALDRAEFLDFFLEFDQGTLEVQFSLVSHGGLEGIDDLGHTVVGVEALE